MAVYYAKEIQAAFSDKMNPSNAKLAKDPYWQCCWVQGSNSYWYHTFLQYDLSRIPYGSKITKAIFRAYEYWKNDNGDSGTTNIARVTEDWDEDTLCWNLMPASVGLYLAESVSPPGVGNWTDWDITTLVQEWVDRTHPNYGLRIVNNNEGQYRVDWRMRNRFYSAGEYATYIKIEYEPVEEYRISRPRMEEIVNQVRRITGTTGTLTPAGIVAALNEIN